MKIDGREIKIMDGDTVLTAARRAGIRIPTLCHSPEVESNTSCMVCLVENKTTGRLIPSCCAPAGKDMEIVTTGDRIRKARQAALELLLSEHVGDCEAPCKRGCPAGMEIPLMIRQIRDGRMQEAFTTAVKGLVFPAVLGRVCPAPCEKICRRREKDSPVSILNLKRYVGDWALKDKAVELPACAPDSGREVTIVGGGPAGLSAAFYLGLAGHSCSVLESSSSFGGKLTTEIEQSVLPADVLNGEVKRLEGLGIKLFAGTTVGKDVSLGEIMQSSDAVVIATGRCDRGFLEKAGLKTNEKGLDVNRLDNAASLAGVFGCGSITGKMKMAVKAVASGRAAAAGVCAFLDGKDVSGRKRLDVRTGKLLEGELEEFMKEADTSRPVEAGRSDKGFTDAEAVAETGRCMHCDCRNRLSCGLRQLAEEYDARFARRRRNDRERAEKDLSNSAVVFEPGKCIKCGICVGIADRSGEHPGLTFVNRGMRVRVAVPFDGALDDVPQEILDECAEKCPTGALAFAAGDDEREEG